jgi:N-acyl-D-amino-acid deacylase
MALDLVITGGSVLDGTGAPAQAVDLLVEGDRVVGLGTAPAEHGGQVVDATGLTVAPGFVNVLSHAWASLQVDGAGASDVLQGVTTEVFGEAFSLGPSNADFADLVSGYIDGRAEVRLMFDHLREGLDHLASRGIAPNVASFIGGTNLRILGARFEDRPLEAHELDRLKGVVAEEMQDGALGIGTALIYPPGRFARSDELVELCRVVGQHDGTYISHMRSEGDWFLECLDELIDIGAQAGCRVESYHLKAAGRHNWHKMQQAIDRIEKARAGGQPVTADMYPYTAGGTALRSSIPPRFHVGGPDAFVARLADADERAAMVTALSGDDEPDFENLFVAAGAEGILFGLDLEDGTPAAGRTLHDLSLDLGLSHPETLVEVVRRSPSTSVLYFIADEANVELGLSQPWVSLGSDAEGLTLGGSVPSLSSHPRAFGTFARFLGHYVRDRGLSTLDEGERLFTSLAAEQLGLKDLGVLRAGAYADLVVLDPATVSDRATYQDPAQYAVGVRDVVVNGRVVVRDGAMTTERPGRRVGRDRG